MKRLLPLLLLIFSFISNAQESVTIYDSYLHELITATEETSIVNFDAQDITWRQNAVKKITTSLFKDASFLKTSMVLHMLKYKLGDENYEKGLNSYLNELNQHQERANLSDFKKTLQNEIDDDLDPFFNDWFFSKGHPSYVVSWYQNEESKNISILVEQAQSDTSVDFFEMPLPIKVQDGDGNSQIIRLEISGNKQSFSGYIPFRIKTVEIDPEAQIISYDNSVKQGVDQEILNTSISLYPNPAKNSINIENAGEAVVEKISIFNMLGNLILEETNPLAVIDLKPLDFGIHLVKIETSQGTLHKTILKKQ